MAYNTGNPVPSTDAKDFIDNCDNVDKAVNSLGATFQDRLGVTRSTYEGVVQGLSFFNVGTFAVGFTLTNSRQTLTYSGHEYGWSGVFPKVVSAGSTPTPLGSGGWIDRSDVTLRSELSADSGGHLVGHERASVFNGDVSGYFDATIHDIKPGEFNTLTTDTEQIQAAINFAGLVTLPKKQHTITSSVTCDFSSTTFPLLSRNSKRFSINGSGIHSSVLNFNGDFSALNFLGDSDWSHHGTNAAMDLRDFTVYGTGNVGVGLRMTGLAHSDVSRFRAIRCDIGLRVSECLVSHFKNLYLDNNNTGLLLDGAALPSNGSDLSGNFSSNTTYGANVSVGTAFRIYDSLFEHNGTSGDAATGDLRIIITEPMGVVDLDNVYFGFSNGGANLKIENATAGVVIVNINGGVFNRGGPAGEEVTANIRCSSSGGGMIILNLNGVQFFTNTTWGYVPSSSKPFIDDGGVALINGVSTCYFNEQTSKKSTASGASTVLAGSVYTGGDGQHPVLLSSAKSATGVYVVTSSRALSSTVSGYQVVAVSGGISVRVGYVIKNSPTQFTVYMFNTSGVATDGQFDYMITRTR